MDVFKTFVLARIRRARDSGGETVRRILVAAGVSAGCVLLSPVVASADESYPGNPTSMKVTVKGNAVTITGTCATADVRALATYDFYRGQRPIQQGIMVQNGNKHSITFTGVQPGVWYATMSCLEGGTGSWWRKFTVGITGTPTPTKPTPKPTKPKPKPAPQVAVKPQGAPQTGGGPADDESGVPALVAGGAILLVGAGGAGTWVLRRRNAARR